MSTYNVSKLRILAAIDYLNCNKITANSKSISKLTGLNHVATCVRLHDHRYLLNVRYDKKHTDRCSLKYSLNKKGKSRLNLMLDRLINGQHLKLREKPMPYDWTGFVLLPGLVEKEKN